MLRYLLLLIGVLTFGLLLWRVGPSNVARAASELGAAALIAVLLPSLLMYTVDAYGWKVTLGPVAQKVPFWRLLAIRTAGEVVNMTTPTAYVGGEPLKAYLLKRYQVPIVDGLASVVIAKTTMTIAEVLFIFVGIALAFWILGTGGSSGRMVIAGVLSLAVLVCGTVAFVFVQRRGLFTFVLAALRKLRIRVAYLETREATLADLDRTIGGFYREHRRAFYASTGLYLVGWLGEALEVYVMARYLGGPADMLTAVSIGALSVLIKGGTFFIPGSLGAQDAGNVLLFSAFGHSPVSGATFALLRRFREGVWIVAGLGCLAAMRGTRIPEESDLPSGPTPS